MLKYIFMITSIIAMAFIAFRAETKTIDERVYLVPAGDADKNVMDMLKEKLPGLFPMTVAVDIVPQEKVPESACNAVRKQYDAQMILDYIAPRALYGLRAESALVVADVDMYSEGLNFVFGLSDASKSAAVISLARLRNEFYGRKPNNRLFLNRALKEAAHEIGHLWGLSHCENPKCVMYFSNTLEDTDKKRAWFCRNCERKLRLRYGSPIFKTKLF